MHAAVTIGTAILGLAVIEGLLRLRTHRSRYDSHMHVSRMLKAVMERR